MHRMIAAATKAATTTPVRHDGAFTARRRTAPSGTCTPQQHQSGHVSYRATSVGVKLHGSSTPTSHSTPARPVLLDVEPLLTVRKRDMPVTRGAVPVAHHSSEGAGGGVASSSDSGSEDLVDLPTVRGGTILPRAHEDKVAPWLEAAAPPPPQGCAEAGGVRVPALCLGSLAMKQKPAIPALKLGSDVRPIRADQCGRGR